MFEKLTIAGSKYQAKINSPLKYGVDKAQCPIAYENVKQAIASAIRNEKVVARGVIGDKKYGAFLLHDTNSNHSFVVIINDRYATIGRKYQVF